MKYWLLISCYRINALKIVCHFQIAVNGQSFNRSARDAWELFQSTGIESLVAYDCSGAILLMSTILGGLITGTCMGVWTYFKQSDKAVMVGSTSMLMGMILVSANISIWICMTVVTKERKTVSKFSFSYSTICASSVKIDVRASSVKIDIWSILKVGLTVVVVESAVTSIYICYAEDPLLIQRWDPEFFEQMSEALHQRLQYRSARARQILNGRLDHLPHTSSIWMNCVLDIDYLCESIDTWADIYRRRFGSPCHWNI